MPPTVVNRGGKTPKVTVFMAFLESSARIRIASYPVYLPEGRRELGINLDGFTCKKEGWITFPPGR